MIRVHYGGFIIELPEGTVDDMTQVIQQVHQLESIHMACQAPMDINIERLKEVTSNINTEVKITPEITPPAVYTGDMSSGVDRIPNTPIQYDGVKGIETEEPTSRFRCPECGQAKMIFLKPYMIMYDIHRDMLAVVKHPDEEFDFASIDYHEALKFIDQATYGTQIFADETAGVCPYCHEVKPAKEWVITFLNAEDNGFKDCINCGKGNMESVVTSIDGQPATVKQCPECEFKTGPIGGDEHVEKL